MAVTIRDIDRAYRDGDELTMLTAYDAPMARLVDAGGVDMILVGDSAAHNHMGWESTIPLELDDAVANTAAVTRAVERAFVVGDLPFGAYGASLEQGVENATRLVKEGGADAVKFETPPGGDATVKLADRLTELGVPVQGHVGLTPQREKEIGGPVIQGKDGPDSAFADELVETARELEAAGAFSIVVELTTEGVARRVTEAVDVPTIGIGAGRYTDGQVLVLNDVVGLGAKDTTLSKQYADVDAVVEEAVSSFVADVEAGEFPTADHAFDPVE